MTVETSRAASRPTAAQVNVADPTGLLLGEAWRHLRHNRLVVFLTSWWGGAILLVALGLGLWVAPATASALAAEVGGAAASVTLLYLWWYARFVDRNRTYGTLCPECTSRMWQLCCARCREPIPPLALWLGGALLGHCPHCDLCLSIREGTLLAWCSTCSHGFPRPDLLYAKPTFVIVWAYAGRPRSLAGAWRPVAGVDGPGQLYYHPGDEHSASFAYLVSDRAVGSLPAPLHLLRRTRLLLIDKEISPLWADSLEGFFVASTIRQYVDGDGRLPGDAR